MAAPPYLDLGDAAAEGSTLFHTPERVSERSYLKSLTDYQTLYDRSIDDPAGFWSEIAADFHWEAPWDPAIFHSHNFDVNQGKVEIKWLEGARTNICYNCLDRHIARGLGGQVAFYFEGNDPGVSSTITYSALLGRVCKFANALKAKGVQKGDPVAIYQPMILDLVVAMLATARIGAVHSIIFGGFSAVSLADRILDSKCKVLVTADGVFRGAKFIALKHIANDALEICRRNGFEVSTVIVSSNLGQKCPEPVSWNPAVDCWMHDLEMQESSLCDAEWVDAEHPLFMLYTSGSTGKPKGVLHTTGGYMLWTATTHKYTFDYHANDVYWCTADIGWITGHSYITYGPLLNGAISVMFEGIPTFPDASRFWKIVEKYKVTQFYTAPTAIRALMRFGDAMVTQCDLSSLRILGTVGEPINPEAWLWYYNVVGGKRCYVADTWWQTETGGHMMTGLPGVTPMKPGSTSLPMFGVQPALVDADGKELEGPAEGYLVIKAPWPGQMRTVFGDHKRFETTYFSMFKGFYTTGDGARRDEHGYYWITGRIDDIINVSGHRIVVPAGAGPAGQPSPRFITTHLPVLIAYRCDGAAGTAELESSLARHPDVVEAAVVGIPHDIKGEGIYAFVITRDGVVWDASCVAALKAQIRSDIGAFAVPDVLHNAPGLPKTRSGKIMRRILRKIAAKEEDSLGDISTLAEPAVVDALLASRPSVCH